MTKEEQKKEEEQKPVEEQVSSEEKKEEKIEEKKETSEVKEKKNEGPEKESEEKSSTSEEKKPEPSSKYKDLIKQIESLSVADLAELVKELEERFGVSAAAPVAVSPTVSGGASPAGEEAPTEEKSLFTIELAEAGNNKIAVIKAVREVLPDLGLKEAKDLVEAVPKVLKENVKKEEAEEYKQKLEAAGAKVNLK